MGFWDQALKVAKNVGSVVVTEIEKAANENREIQGKYETMGDTELIDIIFSDGFLGKSSKEKSIAYGILKKRGYSPEEIKARKS